MINLCAMMSKPRAIKTHFKLSNLSFSLLESSNTSFQVQGRGRAWGHGQPMPPPFLSHACRHVPSSRAQALQGLCRAVRHMHGSLEGKGREAPSLLTPLSIGFGIFHSFIVWPLRHSHWLRYFTAYHQRQ